MGIDLHNDTIKVHTEEDLHLALTDALQGIKKLNKYSIEDFYNGTVTRDELLSIIVDLNKGNMFNDSYIEISNNYDKQFIVDVVALRKNKDSNNEEDRIYINAISDVINLFKEKSRIKAALINAAAYEILGIDVSELKREDKE